MLQFRKELLSSLDGRVRLQEEISLVFRRERGVGQQRVRESRREFFLEAFFECFVVSTTASLSELDSDNEDERELTSLHNRSSSKRQLERYDIGSEERVRSGVIADL